MEDPADRVERRTVLGTAGTLAASSLAGCAALGGGGGSHVRIGTLRPPVTLDPVTATTLGSRQVIGRVFDGLYGYDDGTELIARVAAGSPTRESARRVRVRLREDARFQNGDRVTASDVAYSYRAPVESDAPTEGAVDVLDRVEVVDDRTVLLVLGQPSPTLERLLTWPIVPAAVREGSEERFAREPVGAGPFAVEHFQSESSVRLRRWDGYAGETTPAVERVTVKTVGSPITQATSLRTNRADVVEPVSPQLREKIERVSGGTVATRDGYRALYVGFNVNQGPTTDRHVREAIAHAVDLDRIVEELVEPMGSRAYSILPPSVAEAWNFPIDRWRAMDPAKDLARARELFERAAVDVGKLTVLTADHPLWKALAYAVAGAVRDAGRSVRVEEVGWKAYRDRHVSGADDDYSLFVGEARGTADPDSFVYPTFHENVAGATNGVFYREEAPMNHILAARETTERARRREHYRSALATLLDDRTYLPVCSLQNSFALDPAVEHFRVHPVPSVNPRLVAPSHAVEVGGRR